MEAVEMEETERKHMCAKRAPLGCVVPAGMCKSVLPKVEGEAFPGAELIDLTKI